MRGYSSMWLTILYIIGAYFGKYIIINKNKTGIMHLFPYFLIFIFCSFLSSEIKFKLMIIKSKIPNGILIMSISIYFLCVFIDYFRLIIFKSLKIREFCISLEKKIPKLLDKLLCI